MIREGIRSEYVSRPCKLWAMRRTFRDAAFFSVVLASITSTQSAAGQTLSSPRAGIWWRAASSTGTSTAPEPVTNGLKLERSISWQRAAHGIDWADLEITVGAGPLRVHVILARFDPSQFKADLARAVDASGVRGVWTVDSAAADIRIAVNAGQFAETGPWGWMVVNGREVAGPGRGPLATGIAFDSAGNLHWLDPSGLDSARRSRQHFMTAFQSYPRLLSAGSVTTAIRTGNGVDSGHRDARLALGQRLDGRIIIALTRFGVRETVASRIPIGLTLRETAALMGALGCRNAVMLDGGLSAQMLIRTDSPDSTLIWRGARRVPVALVFRER
jgi:hypothetical protein